MTGILKVDDIKDAGANSIVSSNGSGTLTFGSFTAPNITASTAILPDASDGAAIGSASLEWSDIFLADGAVINLGDDQDVTLTHVADTGITLNSTNKLMFNDASQFIQGSSATVLSIGATDEIDLTATTVDLNGTLNVSGVATFQATPVFSSDITVTDDINLVSDSSQMTFGADNEITLTHVHDSGLALKHTATADDKPITLVLQTGETDMAANDVIGAIKFQAPDEGTGTDAILVAAGIQAVAEGDFSSSSNATRLEFLTAASEAASSKMNLTSGGILNVTELHGGSTNDAGGTISISTGDSGASANSNASQLVVENNGAAGISILSFNNNYGNLYFGDGQDDDVGGVSYNHSTNLMTLTTAGVERMVVGAEVAVNDDATDTGAAVFKVKGAQNNDVAIYVHKNTSGSETMLRFRDGDQTTCGTIGIDTGGNTVSYNTSSDYRLKKNEVEITDGITKVKSLKPYRFNWKSKPDGDKVDGFFAHEAKAVVPESVQGEKDAFEKYREHQERPEDKDVGDFKLDESGNKIPKYQQIDQAKLVPVLTAALKEAITKIETLETKVKALEDA